RAPMAVILLGIFLLSLLGLPPLVGFAAKFQIFSVLYDAGREYTTRSEADRTLGYTMYALLLIGGVNTVVSAVYYLRVMKTMIVPELLRREDRSFLQYIRESYPWAKGKSEGVRETVMRVANAEDEFQARLARLMQKRLMPMPAQNAFPTAFTNFNFLAVSYLL